MDKLIYKKISEQFKRYTIPISLLFFSTVFSVTFHGFDFPAYNNVFHIPIVLGYANSVEGPSDIFHQTLVRFISAFWIIISFITNEKNIFYIFLALHVLIRFFIIYIIYKIVNYISGQNKNTAFFCSFILFFDTFIGSSPLGHNEIFAGYLTHSQAVIPIVLLSWLYILKRRFLLSSAVLGVAFDINAFVGVWGGLVAGITMLLCLKEEPPIKLIKISTKMIFLFIIFAFPVIVWLIQSVISVAPHPAFSYRQYLREYYPNHNFIDVQWYSAVSMLLSSIAGFFVLKRSSIYWPVDYKNSLFYIFSLYFAILIFGALLPYLTDSRLLLNLYPLRMDSYIIFLLGIVVLAWCVSVFKKVEPGGKAYPVIALFSLVNGNLFLLLLSTVLGTSSYPPSRGLRYSSMVLWSCLVAAHMAFGRSAVLAPETGLTAILCFVLQVCVIISFLCRETASIARVFQMVLAASFGVIPQIYGGVSLGAIFVAYFGLIISVYWKSIRSLALIVAVSDILIIAAISFSKIWFLAVILAFLMPVIASKVVSTLLNNLPMLLRSDGKMLSILYVFFMVLGAIAVTQRGGLSQSPRESRALIQAELWARQNTPAHTVFLPIGINGFSTLSRRPVWVDWKIGAMVMWAPETYKMWSSRFRELKQVKDVAAAVHLALTQHIGYIVFNKKKFNTSGVDFSCIVFENKFYWIMRPDRRCTS